MIKPKEGAVQVEIEKSSENSNVIVETISIPKTISRKEDRTHMKETHTIIRVISMQPDHTSAFSVQETDAYVNAFLAEGWSIQATHFIGQMPEGFMFAWILVR